MAAVATLFAATTWATFIEHVSRLIAAALVLPPAILLLRAPEQQGSERNNA